MSMLLKPSAPYIDPQVLAIASLTDLPSQPVNMVPVNAILGKQVQQLKTNQAAVPVVSNQAPLYVTKRNLGGGQFQYRVQFFQPPPSQPYQTTSVLLKNAYGSTTVSASSGTGPLVFNGSKFSAPTAATLQQTNSDGAISNPGLGGGLSRGINLL